MKYFRSIQSHLRYLLYIVSQRMLLTVSIALTGCMAGPDYKIPDNKSQIQIIDHDYPEIHFTQTTPIQWWQVFDDPLLTSFIDRALKNNLDLKIAVARVKEARASLGIISSNLLPVVNANTSIERAKQSENVNPLATDTNTTYALSADTSWEIDLFGRIQRSVEAASAEFEAINEHRQDVLITLCADVAQAYLRIRTLQAQLTTATENIQSQQSMLKLTKVRYKYGIATYLDVSQATQVLATTEADLPPIRTNLSQNINSLSILLGENPGLLTGQLEEQHPIPMPPEQVAIGIPARWILQRPDIKRAERLLAAQTARIGIATADLYPSLSLTGNIGYISLESSNLLNASSLTYGLLPALRWNIFDRRKIRQQIQVYDARTEQALYTYELTILRAIEEIMDNLKAYHEQHLRMAALQKSVKASQESLEMSISLYKDGLISFQDVLDTQRTLFATESSLDQAMGSTSIQLVQLYKSLAGNMETEQIATE